MHINMRRSRSLTNETEGMDLLLKLAKIEPPVTSGWREQTKDFFGLSTNISSEDWNARRLRYVMKKYGNIKTDCLSYEADLAVTPICSAPTKPSLQRQVSLLAQLGTPGPLSPTSISVHRHNAIRTLRNILKDSRGRSLRQQAAHLNDSSTKTQNTGILELPSGTLYSPIIKNSNEPFAETFASKFNTMALHAGMPDKQLLQLDITKKTKKTHKRELSSLSSVKSKFTLHNRRSLSCTNLQTTSFSNKFPFTSLLNLKFEQIYSSSEVTETPISKTLTQSIKTKRAFFPSSDASYQSKSVQDLQTLPHMLTDFDLLENDVNPEGFPLLLIQSADHKVSRLDSNRPPPLILIPEIYLSAPRKIPSPMTCAKQDLVRFELKERKSLRSSSLSLSRFQPLNSIDSFSPHIVHRPNTLNLNCSPSAALTPHLPRVMSRKFDGRLTKDKVNNMSSRYERQFVQCTVCCSKRDKETEEIFRRVDHGLLDYRPFFTYFVTFVQVVVMILACGGYGFAPIGLNLEREVTGEVIMPSSLGLERVCRIEDENLWIGPRQADLIRIGARFSPCMRRDNTLHKVVIKAQHNWDRSSGCCVRNDGDSCYQTSRLFCSRSTSTWLRHGQMWTAPGLIARLVSDQNKEKETDKFGFSSPRKLGPVCGLDPEFCEDPRSTGPFTWSTSDVTEWPICKRSTNTSSMGDYARHMHCEVTARPCCVGIKGECIITTGAHCQFLRGHFNHDAFLCSQVNCLGEVCGMVPFVKSEQPDQIYRIFISLFLHAGLLHLLLSIVIQLAVMRNLEKLLGWLRISLIYILSGCFANLASGIMLPYHVNFQMHIYLKSMSKLITKAEPSSHPSRRCFNLEVHTGPTGAHFALFGVVFLDYLQTMRIYASPWAAIMQQILAIVSVFFIGFLPWMDNYAHVSGFISGILLAYVLVPYLGFGGKQQLDMTNTPIVTISATAGGESNTEQNHKKLQLLLSEMKRRRIMVIFCCGSLWILLTSLLILVFIKWPLTNCVWCKYLNCLPLTQNLCNTLEVNVHAPTRCINPHS